MMQPAFIIARFTFLEAVRNRLFTLVIVGFICIFGLTEFIGELTITETKQYQSALTASALRLFTVCLIGLFVVTSMVREFNDKGFEMLLSLEITRTSYYFGKYMGFMLLTIIIAIAASLILIIYSSVSFVLIWLFSLVCESLIIISLSLLCLFTFKSITTAYISVMAFYILSRSMYIVQLVSDSPILESKTFSQEFINFIIDSIAYVLPDLNIFTQSEWLIYGADISNIVPVLIQTSIYFTFLTAAGLFDLYRKEF